MKRTLTRNTPEAFVKAVYAGHKAGKTKAQIAAELGTSLTALSNRVSNFRKHGVPLPKFTRGVQEYDWNALKTLGAQLRDQG